MTLLMSGNNTYHVSHFFRYISGLTKYIQSYKSYIDFVEFCLATYKKKLVKMYTEDKRKYIGLKGANGILEGGHAIIITHIKHFLEYIHKDAKVKDLVKWVKVHENNQDY